MRITRVLRTANLRLRAAGTKTQVEIARVCAPLQDEARLCLRAILLLAFLTPCNASTEEPPAPALPAVAVTPALPAQTEAPKPTPPPPIPEPAMAPVPQSALPQAPRPAVAIDATTARSIAVGKRSRLAVLITAAGRLRKNGRFAQASREFALAHALDAKPAILIEVGRSCRRAELDYEALAIYRRLATLAMTPGEQAEVKEELAALSAKLDEADFELVLAQNLREHLDQAKVAFQRGQFDAASKEFALAYALKPLPRLLFNIAQSYRRSRQSDAAYIGYVDFLEMEPQTPLKNEVLGYIAELRSVAFRPPIYKRAWFWGVLGAATTVVVSGVATIAALSVPIVRNTDGGTVDLTFSVPR